MSLGEKAYVRLQADMHRAEEDELDRAADEAEAEWQAYKAEMKKIADEERRRAQYAKEKFENDKEKIDRHAKSWAK